MKITIAQGAFLPVPPLFGGALEKVWAALGEEFALAGHPVTHLSRRHPTLPHREFRNGVEHIRIPGFDAPRSLWKLKALDLAYSLRVLRALPPADILVTHTFWLPVLVRRHCPGQLYVHVARFPRGQMRLYRHAARLNTVSSAVEKAIVQEEPRVSAQTRFISLPLPYPEHERGKCDNAARRPVILYTGRIHPEKGIALLIDSFREFVKEARFSQYRLRLVGSWEARHGGGGEEFKRALDAQSADMRDKVEWPGLVSDNKALIEEYRSAAAFVYPSLAEKGETFGLSPLEAMNFGCPPVVSNLDCFRDFVDEGVNGLVFDHRAPNAGSLLAQKLRDCLGEPERWSAMQSAGLTTAARFTVPKIARLHLQDFETLIAAGSVARNRSQEEAPLV